jgi:hypothetical protein
MARAILAVTALALCAAASATAAASPAQRAVSVAKLSLGGTVGVQWDALHPKYKAVVSKAKFVSCERKAAGDVGKITVLHVAAEGTNVVTAKLPLLGSVAVNDVTLAVVYRKGAEKSSRIAELDSLWVSHRGKWVRIYTPTEYKAYKAGRCP